MPVIRDTWAERSSPRRGTVAARGTRLPGRASPRVLRRHALPGPVVRDRDRDRSGRRGARGDLAGLAEAFHRRHEQVYEHADREAAVQVINLRMVIIGTSPKPEFPVVAARGSGPGSRPASFRVFMDGALRRVPLYIRDDLVPGHRFSGPAVIAQSDCTTCVPGAMHGEVDGFGNLILDTLARPLTELRLAAHPKERAHGNRSRDPANPRQPLRRRHREHGPHAVPHRALDFREGDRGLHHRTRDRRRQDLRIALRSGRDLVRRPRLRARHPTSSTPTRKATCA